ncbi:MAG: GreA/GreB family elongation factor [Candidatus Peribacteria bacterium]|jgi:transcription elongation factor GreA|nr:GreA/GreB family elongation factor [Candidatus Peribacteria bacterium]
MAQKKFLSREGYEKLVNELKELKQVKLPEVLKTLAESKEMGDLSENFDYKAALEEKDLINSRMKQIEELIEDVEIVEEKQGEQQQTTTGKVVEFGSKVLLQIENDKPYEVTIVGSGEVNIKESDTFISFDSPVGQAIRGKSAGDIAKMRLATTRKDVKILEVK